MLSLSVSGHAADADDQETHLVEVRTTAKRMKASASHRRSPPLNCPPAPTRPRQKTLERHAPTEH
eukprot:3559063-Pyramimonas_sp.AAC.1